MKTPKNNELKKSYYKPFKKKKRGGMVSRSISNKISTKNKSFLASDNDYTVKSFLGDIEGENIDKMNKTLLKVQRNGERKKAVSYRQNKYKQIMNKKVLKTEY